MRREIYINASIPLVKRLKEIDKVLETKWELGCNMVQILIKELEETNE